VALEFTIAQIIEKTVWFYTLRMFQDDFFRRSQKFRIRKANTHYPKNVINKINNPNILQNGLPFFLRIFLNDFVFFSAAIERHVKVKLLVSDWDHTRPSIRNYVRSLTSLDKIDGKVSVEGKLFKVPAARQN
jgi:hypothetical protein